jgi:CBS domain-containing protein
MKEVVGVLMTVVAQLSRRSDRIVASASTSLHDALRAARDLAEELDGLARLATPVWWRMTPHPRTCTPKDSLHRAAQIMRELDCGAVPVVGADGRISGMITDRDVCMAARSRDQPLATMTVESAMSKIVHSCSPGDSLGHAARLMGDMQVRRLPVVERDRLVGMLSLADIARVVRRYEGKGARACETLAHSLALISERRAAPEREQTAAE